MNYKYVLLFLVFLLLGCKMDEAPELANNDGYPVSIVARENLPEWLNKEIDLLIEGYVVIHISFTQASIYRGEWKNQTVYLIQHTFSSCLNCFRDANGERISFTPQGPFDQNKMETMLPGSKNWKIIFQIIDGEIVEEVGTRSILLDVRTPKDIIP